MLQHTATISSASKERPPVMERLILLAERFNNISRNINEFRYRMSGIAETPSIKIAAENSPQPVRSIEDWIATIESHANDIEAVHEELRQRFG